MQKPDIKKHYQLYIDGQWRDSSDNSTFDVYNPATGEKLGTCAAATKKDIDDAVKAGWKAWESWKQTSPVDRAAILNKIADIIDENKERLAAIESTDNGKPIRETLSGDVPDAAAHFRYFAAAISVEEGSAVMLDEDTMSIILREPLGVVGQIVPWNFPLLMGAWKLAAGLAAGCCIVYKPASESSLSTMVLTELIQDIVPKGVLNVTPGGGKTTGGYILEHPDIAKLAFTGSTEVGYTVARQAAEKLIPSTLELGGKSASVFFSDCDLEQAMEGLMTGILYHQGQVCSAGSRVFVEDSIYDKFVEEAVRRFKKVKVGMPLEEDTQMGTLIDEKQMNTVLKYIEIGKKEGAKLACGGERITDGDFAKGWFVQPTLFTEVTNDMQIAREEIFGPVAVVIRFKTEEDAIRMANDSEYGLAGAVFTKDINRAIRVARSVRTGRMWVNTYNEIPAGAPFGGYKKSGIGRETHKMLLDAYTQVKSIFINLSDQTESTWA